MRLRLLPSSSSCASWQPRGRRRSPLLLLYRFSQVLLLSLQLGVLILKGFEFLVHLQTQGFDATVDLARDPGNSTCVCLNHYVLYHCVQYFFCNIQLRSKLCRLCIYQVLNSVRFCTKLQCTEQRRH